MANKIFRQVLCSERLPKENGMYIVQSWKGICRYEFNLLRHTLNKHTSDWLNEIEYWLEEVELPSEEDVYPKQCDASNNCDCNVCTDRKNNILGFNKAIELIKGEGLNNG